MKRNFLLPLFVLFMALPINAKKYYPEMYEPAKTVVEEDLFVIEEGDVAGTLHIDDVPETSVTTNGNYTSENSSVGLAYHVIVGSFSDKENAIKLRDKLKSQGQNPIVAVDPKGVYRVFYYSSNDEAVVRTVAKSIQNKFPGAWILKLKI